MFLARTKLGISKRRLAKLVDVDPSYITHLEAGRRKPGRDLIEKLASAFEMSLQHFTLMSSEEADLKMISPAEAAVLAERLIELSKV